MSLLSTTRVNLAPTARTLASGVPLAPRINLNPASPPGGHGLHAHEGTNAGEGGASGHWSPARSDRVPKFAGGIGAHGMVSRMNANPSGITSHRYINTMTTAVPPSGRSTTQVPDFSPYLHKNPSTNRTLQYFMVGSLGLLAASGAKSTVTDILANMSASADVLALAKIEVEMSAIPEGKNLIAKWRGKPIFIRHRTQDEIKEAESVDVKSLRDPQSDADRVKRPEWLVMLGVCTHLGCVPIGEAGDYGGWFCPCHGSHYDISGRIRKGPAPLNLEVPEYTFSEDEKIVIG